MKEDKKNNYFNSTDLYTVAMLTSQGFVIVEITNEGRTKRFHFEDTEKLRDTILKYTNGTLEGNIRAFKNSVSAIQDLVHSS